MISPESIVCEDIEPVWLNGQFFSPGNYADTWKIQLPPEFTIPEDISKTLSREEQDKALKFYRQHDRQSFIIRRGMLRILLGHYLSVIPREICFEEGSNKKPEIRPKRLYFNVSHSADLILIGISQLETGVDIEKIVAGIDYETIVRHSFSSEEAEFISLSKNPVSDFFKLWARKEAFTKALSKGLDDDFHLIPSLNGLHTSNLSLFTSGKHWKTSSFSTNGYHGATVHDVNQETRFFRLGPDDLYCLGSLFQIS